MLRSLRGASDVIYAIAAWLSVYRCMGMNSDAIVDRDTLFCLLQWTRRPLRWIVAMLDGLTIRLLGGKVGVGAGVEGQGTLCALSHASLRSPKKVAYVAHVRQGACRSWGCVRRIIWWMLKASQALRILRAKGNHWRGCEMFSFGLRL